MMSRSYKKHPGGGICVATGQKKFKQCEHRRERRNVKQQLQAGKEDIPEDRQKYGNEWASPRDGKQYWIVSPINFKCEWYRWKLNRETEEEVIENYIECYRKWMGK